MGWSRGPQTVADRDGSSETREAADGWSRQDLRLYRIRVVVATVALKGRKSLPHQHLLPCSWKPRGQAVGRIERALPEAFLRMKPVQAGQTC